MKAFFSFLDNPVVSWTITLLCTAALCKDIAQGDIVGAVLLAFLLGSDVTFRLHAALRKPSEG